MNSRSHDHETQLVGRASRDVSVAVQLHPGDQSVDRVFSGGPQLRGLEAEDARTVGSVDLETPGVPEGDHDDEG